MTGEQHVLVRSEPETENRHVRVTTTSLDRGGAVRNVVLVLDEMAAEARPQEALAGDPARNLFANLAQGIANDVNNVLATIAYAIDLSLKQTLPEKAASLLMTPLTTIERGQRTTEKMQMLAQDTAGADPRETFASLLEEVAAQAQAALGAGIELKLECDEPTLAVRCDRDGLQSALFALIKAVGLPLGDGGLFGCITVTARTADEGSRTQALRGWHGSSQDYAEVIVATTGAGVAETVLQDLTNPLLDQSDEASPLGPELLAARDFITRAEGDLSASTEAEQGTTLSILLPKDGLHMRQDLGRKTPVSQGSGETVFLVEDDPLFLLMLQEELEDLGYRVISATSGRAAIGLIEQGVEFDLVIADVVMPGDINGFDLANKIRKLRHRSAVLYMSGFSGFAPEDMGDAKAPILKKPCPPNELARAVQVALKERMI